MDKEKLDSELHDGLNPEADNVSSNEANSTDNLTDNSDEKPVGNVSEEENWESKYNSLNDTYLRLYAEFDNYRKRTLKEKSELLKTASERVVLDVIPIIDDFERALENLAKVENSESILEGIKLIHSKFLNTLARHNVKEVDVIGEVFDVEKHEAITTIPTTDEASKDRIVDCIQKGYAMGDKIIRFPKVIVAK